MAPYLLLILPRYDDCGGYCSGGGADIRRRSEAAAESEAGGEEGNFPLGEQRVPAAVGFVRGGKVFAISHVLDNVPKIRSSSSKTGSLRLLPFMFLTFVSLY